MRREVVISAELVVEEAYCLSLSELCRACHVSAARISDMIDEGVVEPHGSGPDDWRFDASALRRMRTALRLQQDLGVNPAGAALALDLLEELATLRNLCLSLGEIGNAG